MINKITYKREFSPIYKMAASGMLKKEIENVLECEYEEKLMSGLECLKYNNILKFRNLEYSHGELAFFDIYFELGNAEELVWLEAITLKSIGGVIMAIGSKYKDHDSVMQLIWRNNRKLYNAIISLYSNWYEDNKYEYTS